MAAVTRRSEIACGRMGFNPLDKDTCCGYTTQRRPCTQQVPRDIRYIAFVMVGHGAHLFHDAGELRGILTQGADLLFCCEEHNRSDDLVRKWLANWRTQEVNDRHLHHLIQQRIRQRTPPDKPWEIAFENTTSQILRSDLNTAQKSEDVKHAIELDRWQQGRSTFSRRAQSVSTVPTPDLRRPAALHLAMPRRSASNRPAIPLPSFSSMSVMNDNGMESMDTYGEVVASPADPTPMSNDTQPLLQSEGNAVSTPSDDSVLPESPRRQSEPDSVAGRASTSHRRGTLSEMRQSLLKAMAQPFSALTTMSSSADRSTASASEASGSGIDPTKRGPGPLPQSSSGLYPVTSPRHPPLVRPSLSIRTTSDATTSRLTPTSASTYSLSKWSPIAKMTSPLSDLSSPKSASKSAVECDICTLSFDSANPIECFDCQACKNTLHTACFKEWNMANFRARQSTPCPYCRTIIRRPPTF